MSVLVIDNYFENPEQIRNIALSAKYYKKENHPGDIAQFPGNRTDYINTWNVELYNYLLKRQLENVKQFININDYNEYWTKFSFSWTDKHVPSIEHVDFDDNWNGFKVFFGGVIYLHPTPPKNTGTNIKDVMTVENVFNRFVMYDATKPHSIENSFGDNINNSRLVLTHFIYLK